MSQEYKVSDCCVVLGLARSSFYRRAKPRDHARLRSAIARIASRYPTYGSRRIRKELEREPYGIEVGRHLVRRLMREMKLMAQTQRRKTTTTDSRHGHRRYPNQTRALTVSRPNQLWVADITCLDLKTGRIYLSLLMDVYTRSIRAWNLSWSLGQELALLPLNQALRKYPAPEIHHSDQGTQYAANAYVRRLQAAGTQISMADKGKPSDNGYAERLIRTIKEEEVYLSEYRNMAEARQQIGHFIDVVYPQLRIHSSLGYMTPAEFEAEYVKNTPSDSGKKCPGI